MAETPTAVEATPDAGSPPVALYVHVPFCVSHCPYCDFVVVAGREARGPANRIATFVEALEAELALRADELDARWGRPGTRPPLATLYFGGGTPSLLPARTIAELIDLVRTRFGLAPDAEISLETNPGPAERGDAAAQRDAGVTRLSIGAQSFDVAELHALGRRHAPADIAATVAEARAAGIPSVSLDLLYDIPGSSLDTWSRTVDAALALAPDHLSLYALTLDDPDAEGLTGAAGDHLPVRAGARRWRDRARTGQDDDRAAAMYELADARLAADGFGWYEISNWARPGHQSRHNLAYWRRQPYAAVGPGAHAFDGVTRRWNAARLDAYIGALVPRDGSSPQPPPGASERADGDIAAFETAMLALRTAEGWAPDGGAGAAGGALDPRLAEPLAAGLLRRDAAGRFALTLRGRLVANEVFGRLLPATG
ncbi:MAG TPA: coproporphyrinogen-III oxidase family protein [Patescibacteria group bacterium]|nr:coproporphyrinogen-III oxidase family protein [Patescibacteria group bacterium]